ncbi:unnamed protein product, partial [marine sediment metagenome]
GAVLDVGTAERGVRAYVAFAGGLDVPAVLGSRATDLLSGLGPAPLSDGARLPLGESRFGPPPYTGDVLPYGGIGAEVVLPLLPGPRADWFAPGAVGALARGRYTVSPASNRIGLRTLGPPVERLRHEELPSEGMVSGSVQVPPDGRPVVFLADHPTTGGYPVIGVVPAAALPAAAQAAPGTPLRFAPAVRTPR